MLFGIALLLTWLVLLIRYPGKALPVSLAALSGLLLVGAWVLWQEHREAQLLRQVHLDLQYAPQACPPDQPLRITVRNASTTPLIALHWDVAALRPGSLTSVAERSAYSYQYDRNVPLQGGQQWQRCMPLPPLQPGYRPETVDFQPERVRGRFTP